jgi:hypothetical protein
LQIGKLQKRARRCATPTRSDTCPAANGVLPSASVRNLRKRTCVQVYNPVSQWHLPSYKYLDKTTGAEIISETYHMDAGGQV